MLKTLTTAALMLAYQAAAAQTTADTLKKEVLPNSVKQLLDNAYSLDSSQTGFDPAKSAYKLVCADEKLQVFADSSVYGVQAIICPKDNPNELFKVTRITATAHGIATTCKIYAALVNGTTQAPSEAVIEAFNKSGVGFFLYETLNNAASCAEVFKPEETEKTVSAYQKIRLN
jgi:hypothetical protein